MRNPNRNKVRRAERRESAIERQQNYDTLATEDKIAGLDKLFGKGKGAVRQRARLAAQPKPKKKKDATDDSKSTNK